MLAGPEVARLFMTLWHTKKVFLMGRNIYITISLPPFRELLFRCEVKLRMHAGHGNPFSEEIGELVALDTKQLMVRMWSTEWIPSMLKGESITKNS